MSHGKDICGVNVHRRWPPFDPIFLRWDEKIGQYYRLTDEEMFSGKLVELDATGTGALLFNMEIFDRIEEPWFKVENDEAGVTGEDFYFCKKARGAGVQIFADSSIEVDHVTTIAINRTMYEIFKKLKPQGGQ
jgi:hypothetical protein